MPSRSPRSGRCRAGATPWGAVASDQPGDRDGQHEHCQVPLHVFASLLSTETELNRAEYARSVIAFAQQDAAIEPLPRLITVDPYSEEGHVLLIESPRFLG